MKQRITVSLPDNVHAWLKAEAEARGLQPGTHAALLLYDIMQGNRSPAATRTAPAQRAQPRTRQGQQREVARRAWDYHTRRRDID